MGNYSLLGLTKNGVVLKVYLDIILVRASRKG